LIGNTPEETVDATDEMDQRLNEKWGVTARFWELYGVDKLRSTKLRISTNFLCQSRELLEIAA